MNYRPTTFLTILLIGLTLNAEERRQEPAIRIEIEPRTVVGRIADHFIGFGYEKSAVALPGYFARTNSHLVNLYRTLTSEGLVRIGGNVSDHTRFMPKGARAARTEKETTVINQASIAEFAGFLRATGWRAMWGLNLGTGSKEEVAQEALAVFQALGDRLQSFEIGNEVDLLPRFKSYEEYHAAYVDYQEAVRKTVPDAVFSGPDVAGNLQWVLKFAETEHGDAKLLTHHYYRTGARRPEASIDTLLRPQASWDRTLEALHQTSRKYALPYRINEVNSFYGGGKAGVSDTFASALWCLDYMFRLAAHGCSGVNMETDINQLGFVSHYSPIFRDSENRLTARPEYYGMLAFALAGRGSLIQTTPIEADINLSVYGTKDSEQRLWVTLVNKELGRQTRIELKLPPGCSAADACRLEAPSVQSTDHVRFGGAEVSPDGTWAPRTFEKLPARSGVATLELQAASAAVVWVH